MTSVVGVPGTDADRVQLEDLPAVVLVDAVDAALGIVEVLQHGGALGAGQQHVAEIAERVLTDHLAVIHRLQVPHVAAGSSDVEVVGPEFDHDLKELTLAEQSPRDSRPAELAHGVPGVGREGGPQLHGRHRQRRIARQVGVADAVVDGRRVPAAGSIQAVAPIVLASATRAGVGPNVARRSSARSGRCRPCSGPSHRPVPSA